MRGPLGSAEFLKDYVKAANKPKPKAAPRPRKFSGTLAWLIGRYRTSAHWKAEISADTRKTRGSIFNKFIDTYGHMPITIETKHFYKIQDTLSATPHAANNLFKALRPVFKYAVKNDILKTNPMLGLEKLKSKNPDGWRAWTAAEMEQFEQRWPVGTKERLAYELIKHTGQRRSDIVRLGRQHEKDGWLIFTQHKGRNVNPQHMRIPIFPELREVIDASETGDLHYLVTDGPYAGTQRGYKQPFTADGFGNFFRDAVRAAGLDGISPHGLRKAFAAQQAEQESSTSEIAALGGWDNLKQVEHYTKSVRRQKLLENVVSRRQNRAEEE